MTWKSQLPTSFVMSLVCSFPQPLVVELISLVVSPHDDVIVPTVFWKSQLPTVPHFVSRWWLSPQWLMVPISLFDGLTRSPEWQTHYVGAYDYLVVNLLCSKKIFSSCRVPCSLGSHFHHRTWFWELTDWCRSSSELSCTMLPRTEKWSLDAPSLGDCCVKVHPTWKCRLIPKQLFRDH